ncbi:MAG: hypothetical protein JXB38_06750 [Anaerolineales bacterium]|nr:hypothetical protein [Anaerolineales bacterium]
MNAQTKQTLQQIEAALEEVGGRLNAIDRGFGDDLEHWREIEAKGRFVRAAVLNLPEDVRRELPLLAAFAESDDPVYGCWGACQDEARQILEDGDTF